MAKFDGVLLCTDFDQTLAIKEQISPENMAAIEYFKANGGRFTVVSGRNPVFLIDHPALACVNAPLAGYNGARIYDRDKGAFLYEGGHMGTELLDFVRPFWYQDPRLFRVWVHSAAAVNPRCRRGEKPEFDGLKDLTELPVYNVVCIAEKGMGEALAEDLRKTVPESFVVSRSWPEGIEIIRKGDEKGDAILRLKDYCGAHLVVTAGDFENDISMLRTADIGYAVGNALPCVKAAADRITVPVEEHAIAAIIADLERELP